MSDEILTTKQNLTEAVQQLIADATAELRRELEQAKADFFKLKDNHCRSQEICDSLRAQLAQDYVPLGDHHRLQAQLETARQEIERLKAQAKDDAIKWLELCKEHTELALARDIARQEIEQLKREARRVLAEGQLILEDRKCLIAKLEAAESDRDKALRVAEEAEATVKELHQRLIIGCDLDEENKADHDKAQSDLSACRALLGDIVGLAADAATELANIAESDSWSAELSALAQKLNNAVARYTALKAGQPVWGDKERWDFIEKHVASLFIGSQPDMGGNNWTVTLRNPTRQVKGQTPRQLIDAAAKQEGK